MRQALPVLFLIAGIFFGVYAVKAAVYDVRIENPSAGDPSIDCDVGNSANPANPDCGFIPRTITINPGDQIRWVDNDSLTSVLVKSNPHPAHTLYTALNMAAPLSFGQTFTTDPLMQVGSWGFHNHLDVSRKGTIIIKAPASGGELFVDTLPPVISKIDVIPSETGAEILWRTNEPASSQITYDAVHCDKDDRIYENKYSKPPDIMAKISHEIYLENLEADKKYCFRLMSMDSSSNLAVSEALAFYTIVATVSTSAGTTMTAEISAVKNVNVENANAYENTVKAVSLKLIELLNQLVVLLNKLKAAR
ncbi:MAG: hypothetical protein HYW34_02100 [Candidatus Brennerbacteria bacterium]|nr:hypothetical protein [Candidatus Brennerbacteria bacterium]